jgi:hypothetical protein
VKIGELSKVTGVKIGRLNEAPAQGPSPLVLLRENARPINRIRGEHEHTLGRRDQERLWPDDSDSFATPEPARSAAREAHGGLPLHPYICFRLDRGGRAVKIGGFRKAWRLPEGRPRDTPEPALEALGRAQLGEVRRSKVGREEDHRPQDGCCFFTV